MTRVPSTGRHPALVQDRRREFRLVRTDRILLLAPHPDDEVLSAGGLLQQAVERGAAVRILYATRGENNPWAQRVHERRWHLGPADRARWGSLRWEEVLAALECLGLPGACARPLFLPDQGLTDLLMQGNPALIGALAEEITRWRPTVSLVPATRDTHPDHGALGVAAHFALAHSQHPGPPIRALEYVVHGRREPAPSGSERVSLTRLQRERKRIAILCHRSQLHLRRRFMLGFARDTETFRALSSDRDMNLSHPVQQVFVTGDSLHVEVARQMAFGAARPELLIAFEGGGAKGRLSVSFDARAGWARLRDSSNGAGPISIPMLVLRDSVRFKLPRSGDVPRPADAAFFAKLDYPGARRMGLFDPHGWRYIGAPLPVGAGGLARPSAGYEAAREQA